MKFRSANETTEQRLRLEKAVHQMKLQKFLAHFACICLALCCVVALALFCLQGFHFLGFKLETGLMHWLGLATVGAIGSLASIVYKSTFKKW